MTSIVFTVTNDLVHDRRMQRICNSLAENGFDVTLIGRELPDSIPVPKYFFKTMRQRCWFNKGKLFYLEYNFRLFWKLLFMKADVYSAVDLDTIIPTFKVAWLKRKKKVFDAHEFFEEVPEVVDRPFTKAVWKLVAKLWVPRADAAMTVSESLAERFQFMYGIPFATIRNVPRLSTAPFVKSQGYLLYQGALNEGRGLEQLIEAMQFLDIPLKIAGEGDLSSELRELSKKLGVEHQIRFLGFVPPDKLDELTARAWLGINVLENRGLSYYYSLANKFFDYINHGVPSLNMDFPEYRKINAPHEVSVLLKELSYRGIVDAVRMLQEDTAMYERLRENCIAARAELNWEKEEQKLLKLYRQIK